MIIQAWGKGDHCLATHGTKSAESEMLCSRNPRNAVWEHGCFAPHGVTTLSRFLVPSFARTMIGLRLGRTLALTLTPSTRFPTRGVCLSVCRLRRHGNGVRRRGGAAGSTARAPRVRVLGRRLGLLRRGAAQPRGPAGAHYGPAARRGRRRRRKRRRRRRLCGGAYWRLPLVRRLD